MVTQHLELPITGMTCANCAANIERALNKKVKGVTQASVNFAFERAANDFIPDVVGIDDIVEMMGSILGAMCGLVFGFIIVILIDCSPGMRRRITPVITDIVTPYIGMSVTNKTYCKSC